MLEKYRQTNPILYKQLKTDLRGKIFHAYIFVAENKEGGKEIVYDFIKQIICPAKKDSCKECNICKNIDNNTFTEFIIIEAEGLWIKKEQIISMQKRFSTKPIEGKKNVYLINEPEKMNKYSINSLLKILEEPSEDIVAILYTENFNLLPETIVSRCKTIFIESNEQKKIDTISKLKEIYGSLLFESESDKILMQIIDLIIKYEKIKIQILSFAKKYFHNHFKEREKIYTVFEVIILFYKDVLNQILGRELEIFNDYKKDILEVSSKNTKEEIIRKINVLLVNKKQIRSGINLNLFFEKVIIELEG